MDALFELLGWIAIMIAVGGGWIVVALVRNGYLRFGNVRKVRGLMLPAPDDAAWRFTSLSGWACGPVGIAAYTSEYMLRGPSGNVIVGGAARRYVRAVLKANEQSRINDWQEADTKRLMKGE